MCHLGRCHANNLSETFQVESSLYFTGSHLSLVSETVYTQKKPEHKREMQNQIESQNGFQGIFQ